MRELTISLSDSTVIIRGVAFADLSAFSTLMTQIQSLWADGNRYSVGDLLLSSKQAEFLDLAQKIVNLHPRVDTPGVKGFDVKPLLDDRSQIEELFFLRRAESDRLDINRPCLLMRLNGLDGEKKLTEEVPEYLDQQTQLQASPPNSPDSLPMAEVIPLQEKSSKQGRSGGSRTSAAS